jgi:hypothetical protein
LERFVLFIFEIGMKLCRWIRRNILFLEGEKLKEVRNENIKNIER